MSIFDFETPTGQKGNLINPKDVGKGIMGVVAFLLFMAVGTQVAGKIDELVPLNTSKVGTWTEAKAVETKQGSVIV